MRDDHPTRRGHWLILLGILLLAAGLRVAGLQREPLWLDELWTVQLSSGRGSAHLELPANKVITSPPITTPLDGARPWHRVWTGMESATHPPLYFVLLRVWREAFGEGDMTGRMLSVLASLGAIVLLFDSVRRMAPPAVGLWAAAIMALAPQDLEYARQARNYAMLILLGLAAINALVRIEQRGISPLRLAALGLSIVAMMLTHYFAAGAAAAIGTYALLRLHGRGRWAAMAALTVSAAIFLVAWGPWMLQQAQRFGDGDPTTAFLARGDGGLLWPIWGAASIPIRLLTPVPAGALWDALASLAGGAIFFIVPAALIMWRGRRDLLLWTLWLVMAVGFVALLDAARETQQLRFLRYTVLAGPAVYVLVVGIGWGERRRWVRLVPPILALLLGALALPRVYRQLTPDWPALSAEIEAAAGPRDVIVIASPGEAPWTNSYIFIAYSHYADEPLRPVVLLRDPPSSALLAELRAAPGVWLVLAGEQLSPVQVLPGFRARGGPVDPPISLWQMDPQF